MAKVRLVELYPIEMEVQILLGEAGWQAGQVTAHQHPGVWVVDGSDRSWFVTNRRHIRPLAKGSDHES